jgi:L-2-hydroxyglutarate oxidase
MPAIAVIGGGLIGLATAYKLRATGRADRIVVLEKESDVARHQSTHNSGVLHAGLYYKPGSLKARFARDGLREMVAFCSAHDVRFEQCGKVVVAASEDELEPARALFDRGSQNGLHGLRWLDDRELREIEPHARGVGAIHVPEEGIADFATVAARLKTAVADVLTDAPVRALRLESRGWRIQAGDHVIHADIIVNCAGLHADRVARLAGEKPDTRIVPFRGQYYMLRPEAGHLVRNLIYPVPNAAFPFLGVHLTRTIHGEIEAGPNAVLAFSREGYRWRDIHPGDAAKMLAFPGLWRFVRRYPGVVSYELLRSFSRTLFVKSLQRLVPALRSTDLTRGIAGVRAQAMRSNGELVEDFDFITGDRAVHVLNAPSPGATASLAIGAEIARIVTLVA